MRTCSLQLLAEIDQGGERAGQLFQLLKPGEAPRIPQAGGQFLEELGCLNRIADVG